MIGLIPLSFSVALDATPTPPATTPQIAAGTYAYKVSVSGQNSGQSTIVVKRDGTTTQIEENTSGSYGNTAGQAKAVLNLGADLAPTTYTNAFSAGGYNGQLTATFTNAQATVNGGLSGGSKTFDLGAAAKHFVVLDGAELSGFIALPAEMQAWNNAPALAVFPLYGQTIALTPKAADAKNRPASVSATDQGVSVDGPAPFTIWYDPATFVMDELDVPSQNFVVTRTKA